MPVSPNIILFLTDDHGPWTLPDYGNLELQTPHLSRLAREGTLFRNAFTPSPVCSPARACLMTGRTPSQVGIHDWLQEQEPQIGQRDWLADEITLPELIRDGGYHTILAGKWHLGRSHEVPRGFVRGFGLPGAQGGHHGKFIYHQDGIPVELEGNNSRIITDRALEMLEEAPADRPFFLNVGYITTHSPYASDAHDPALVREVENCTFADIPAYVPHPWVKNEGTGASPTETELRDMYRGYYAAVLELDQNVGRILDFLETRGLLENTIVVYTSDHGCSMGQNGFFGKGNSTRPLNMYDVSLRVPLLLRGPGIQAGRRVEENVDHYDLFQTLLTWGGVETPSRGYPGCHLTDLNGNHFGEYGDLRMIRTPQHKFVKRYPHGPHDLFDLEADPGETRNLAGLPDYAELQEELERALEEWYQAYEDPMKSGLNVKKLPIHNLGNEAWRDGRREDRGLQVYD